MTLSEELIHDLQTVFRIAWKVNEYRKNSAEDDQVFKAMKENGKHYSNACEEVADFLRMKEDYRRGR